MLQVCKSGVVTLLLDAQNAPWPLWARPFSSLPPQLKKAFRGSSYKHESDEYVREQSLVLALSAVRSSHGKTPLVKRKGGWVPASYMTHLYIMDWLPSRPHNEAQTRYRSFSRSAANAAPSHKTSLSFQVENPPQLLHSPQKGPNKSSIQQQPLLYSSS